MLSFFKFALEAVFIKYMGMLVSLFTLSVLSQTLSQQDLGFYFLALSFIMLLAVPVNGALEGYLTRYIADIPIDNLFRNFWPVIRKLFPYLLIWQILMILLVSIFFKLDTFNIIEVATLVLAMTTYYMLLVTHRVLWLGDKKVVKATIIDSVIRPGLLLLAVFFFVEDIYTLYVSLLVTYIFCAVWISLNNLKEQHLDKDKNLDFKEYFVFIQNNALVTLGFQLPLWVAAYLEENVAAVGIALRWIVLVQTFFVVISNVFAANSAQLGMLGEKVKLAKLLFGNWMIWVAILTISLIFIHLLLPKVYELFFDISLYQGMEFVMIVVIGVIFLKGLFHPVSHYIIGSGKAYKLNYLSLLSFTPYLVIMSLDSNYSSLFGFALSNCVFVIYYIYFLKNKELF